MNALILCASTSKHQKKLASLQKLWKAQELSFKKAFKSFRLPSFLYTTFKVPNALIVKLSFDNKIFSISSAIPVRYTEKSSQNLPWSLSQQSQREKRSVVSSQVRFSFRNSFPFDSPHAGNFFHQLLFCVRRLVGSELPKLSDGSSMSAWTEFI